MAEIRQQPGGGLNRGAALRVRGAPEDGLRGEPDPQGARLHLSSVEEGPVGWGGVRRADVRPLRGVEERRAVPHRAADHMPGDQPVPPLTLIGAQRRTTARRLEPEQPASRCGDTDAAATVPSVRDRDDARRHGSPRTTTGAARGVVAVPRIAGRAAQLRLGHPEDPELRAVGLADEDHTRTAVAREQLRVVVGDVVHQRSAGERARLVSQEAVHVLDQERDPSEGAIGQVSGRVNACLVIHAVDHGIELAIDHVRSGDGRVDELGRCHLPRADQCGKADGILGGVLIVAHAPIVDLPVRRCRVGWQIGRERSGRMGGCPMPCT